MFHDLEEKVEVFGSVRRFQLIRSPLFRGDLTRSVPIRQGIPVPQLAGVLGNDRRPPTAF